MDTDQRIGQAQQERAALKEGVSASAKDLIALAEREGGLDQALSTPPPVPASWQQNFEAKFPEHEPNQRSQGAVRSRPSWTEILAAWWRHSAPAFGSGMAVATVMVAGLFLFGPFQQRGPVTPESTFRGHGTPATLGNRAVIITFENLDGDPNPIQQQLQQGTLSNSDVREVTAEDELYQLIEDNFDAVHIIVDEVNQTVRGLVPSITTRQVQDSFDPPDPDVVGQMIENITRACLILASMDQGAP